MMTAAGVTGKRVMMMAPGPFGGAERVFAGGAAALQALDPELDVWLLREVRAPQHCDDLIAQLPETITPVVIDVEGRLDRAALRALVSQIAAQDVALIHTHGFKASIYTGLLRALGRLGPCKFVATHHGVTSHSRIMRLYERAERWALARADSVVAVSPKMADDLASHGLDQAAITTIENMLALAVPVASGQDWPADPLRLTFIGRLSHEKGCDLLLDAMARLDRAMPVRLDILGDGEERAALEKQALSLTLEDRVVFHGFVPDLASHLTGHAVIAPSRREGLPMAMIEAAAAGLPIIAARVGGLPRLVDEGRTGLLVEPQSAEALARAIRDLAQSWPVLADGARTYAETIRSAYAPSRWAEKTLALYDTVQARGVLT